MLRDFSLQSLFMGLLTAFVGFASSFAVVLHGLTGVGASEAQAGVRPDGAVGGNGRVRDRAQPCHAHACLHCLVDAGRCIAASSGTVAGGFNTAVGGFLICGALIVVAGLWKPLGRAVAAIPAALAMRCWRGC